MFAVNVGIASADHPSEEGGITSASSVAHGGLVTATGARGGHRRLDLDPLGLGQNRFICTIDDARSLG